MDDRRRLGALGEDRAARWYAARGWTVVDRNWRHGRMGELDLVVVRGDTVAFVEVKTRSSDRFGSPLEAITPAKAARIRRLASAWLAQRPQRRCRIRCDVVAIGPHGLEVVEAAF